MGADDIAVWAVCEFADNILHQPHRTRDFRKMHLLLAQRLVLVQVFATCVAANREWLILGLPECWQIFLGSTEDDCGSRSCVCKTTESNAPYLPGIVTCLVSQCKADQLGIKLFLGPLQLYCSAIGCSISDQVIGSAYAATSATDSKPSTVTEISSSRSIHAPERRTTHRSDGGAELTKTMETTIVQYTTDGDGNGIQIMVSLVIGTSGIHTGAVLTSTVKSKATSTIASPTTSISSSGLPSYESAAASTRTPASTSAEESQATVRPGTGNGSPFENMQAGAGKWCVPALLLGLGALVAWLS
ncbi:hypothetical protein T440DRAFT_463251 [Plenodomus tracheiphilus IPT5]|uniref:Extracellular membrane protein CFEM domain-containing protein n=1 Tax=Plenodomus tracheiphilus IPT5 TaxID=1408161 RepID=A0A6A7BN02_9PLEO|nr:hypothetical protein T440DRAFT_463251 [Plenodomus tracheiphilus IPT5]